MRSAVESVQSLQNLLKRHEASVEQNRCLQENCEDLAATALSFYFERLHEGDCRAAAEALKTHQRASRRSEDQACIIRQSERRLESNLTEFFQRISHPKQDPS